MANIVVIGAGVVGLTNAYELAKLGHSITIVAQTIPSDFQFHANYTSPFAGANWHSFASLEDKYVQDIDIVGYHKFLELCNVKHSGVVSRRTFEYHTKDKFKKDGNLKDLPWFKNMCKNFEIIENDSELIPKGVDIEYGFAFDGVVISTTYYLTYLLNECFRLGVTLKRKTLKSLQEASQYHSSGMKADVIVNCSGLLAKSLVPDDTVYPIRGCTILVYNNIKDMISVNLVDEEHPDEMLYIMPRKEGGCVIGGSFQINNENTDIDEDQVDRILARASKYAPELIDPELGNNTELEIVRKQVGFRPARTGGYRIELDETTIITTTSDNNDKTPVVHCYGHGGAGYQSSWGSSELVTRIIANHLCNHNIT
ncbi:hypothetical protein CANARDRAFT_193881 [[Candida] arabinofermentans NRRL YB-2248]|uniref:FAD dependent oxidoreductase domain-containing protein n=1 Tax=[Candida] arabinofermentans NRRL YB-2248 TaxID=983967 RepID=A0A1E4T8I3_9ASCO|nr:hypothetical protein CANARDRAFT_193881 [[Candida] arabinofermentans NRRL YB-2248]